MEKNKKRYILSIERILSSFQVSIFLLAYPHSSIRKEVIFPQIHQNVIGGFES